MITITISRKIIAFITLLLVMGHQLDARGHGGGHRGGGRHSGRRHGGRHPSGGFRRGHGGYHGGKHGYAHGGRGYHGGHNYGYGRGGWGWGAGAVLGAAIVAGVFYYNGQTREYWQQNDPEFYQTEVLPAYQQYQADPSSVRVIEQNNENNYDIAPAA